MELCGFSTENSVLYNGVIAQPRYAYICLVTVRGMSESGSFLPWVVLANDAVGSWWVVFANFLGESIWPPSHFCQSILKLIRSDSSV